MKDNKKDNSNTIEDIKPKRLGLKIGIVVVAVILIGCVIYIFTPYKASENVAMYLSGEYMPMHDDGDSEEYQTVTVTKVGDSLIAVQAEEPVAGMIFYPGGRVCYDAYVPLMYAFAERGVSCFLVKMPLNFAFLDINAADEVKAMYPDIESWYIGGHSLGGAMAANYVSKHTEEYAGLMLLGAYSVDDLSETDLKVFLAYGTQDGVINRNLYASSLKNIPDGSNELIIVGGCHAYFGDYGKQYGDGHPSITAQEQIDFTVRAFIDYVSLYEHE